METVTPATSEYLLLCFFYCPTVDNHGDVREKRRFKQMINGKEDEMFMESEALVWTVRCIQTTDEGEEKDV